MIDINLFSSIQEKITSAQSIYIIIPKDPDYDQVAGGLALYLSLNKAAKQVSIASPQPMIVEFSSLIGVNKVKNKLTGRNLMVSFDYLEDSIEKVSYNIEDGKFNLLVQSKEGFPPLSTQNVRYSYSGGLSGVVLAMGVADPKSLGELYENNKELFSGDNFFNFTADEASSVSEKATAFLSFTKLPVDQDIATNLLLGIEKATDGFTSPKATADTFEAVAFCLRNGGIRGMRPTSRVPASPKAVRKTVVANEPDSQTAPLKPEGPMDDEKPSPDWLQPKIYKGNTRV